MGELRQWIIYTLSDPRDGAIRYVGMTQRSGKRRLIAHCTEARVGQCSHQTRRGQWIWSLLQLELRPVLTVVETGHGNWLEAERKWIRHYRDAGCELTNAVDGGAGPPAGFKMPPRTPEWTASIATKSSAALKNRPWSAARREAQQNRPHTEETKAKMRAAYVARGEEQNAEIRAKQVAKWIGRPRSQETRAKLSAALKGRKPSQESLAKISAALRGKPKPPMTPEHRANIGAAQRGKIRGPRSEEVKAKISAAQKGRPRSPEHAAKLAASNTGKTMSAESRSKMSAAQVQAWKRRKAGMKSATGQLPIFPELSDSSSSQPDTR